MWRRRIGGLAAAVVLGLCGTLWWRSYSTNLLSKELVYSTTAGQRATLTPDAGVTITMAPETELRYVRGANNTVTAELSGEAYFEIQHSAHRQFTVMTQNVQAHVLGTGFNVQAYRADSVTEISVLEGKVSAGKTGPGVVLSQGMRARIGDSTTVMRQGAESSVTWMRGELVFRETPVPAMLRTAGRWFGYEFRLADSTLATRHVTTVLLTDRPSEAMTLIASVLNVRITLDGNVATLHPRRTSANSRRNVPVKTNTTIGSTILREAGK